MIRALIQTFQDSIYSKEFYRGLPSRAMSESVYYYLLLVLLAAIIFAVAIGLRFMPAVNIFARTAGPAIIQAFPQDLVIEIKNGQATHNSEDPVMIPNPFSADMPFRYLLVVDTKNQLPVQDFDKYDTILLLTNNSIISQENKGQAKISSLKDSPNVKIDRQQLTYWQNSIQPFLEWLIPIMFIGLFIAGFFVYASFFLRIILAALVIWAFYGMKKINLPFKRAYQVAIHASTLSFVLIGVVSMLFMPFPIWPFLFTVITVVVAIVNFSPPQSPDPAPLP